MHRYSVALTDDAENDIAELMAFYDELAGEESAMQFFDEAMNTIARLEYLPHAQAEMIGLPGVHKIQMPNYKVAIIYLIDDDCFEVVAVRAYHQMQDPVEYRKSVRARLRKLREL